MTVSELISKIILTGSLLGAFSMIATAFGLIVKYLLKPIRKELRENDVRQCRIFLAGFLCDLEHGVEKDEAQWQLAHEIYDHYIDDLDENSYIHDKWERVVTHGNNE